MKIGESKDLPELYCLNCSELIDSATPLDGDKFPTAGDATICIYCGHLMVFDWKDDLILRNPTDSELVKLAGDKRLLAIQNARGSLKKEGKP